jgi:ribosomal protein S18 acetylase RimI-like enzyme
MSSDLIRLKWEDMPAAAEMQTRAFLQDPMPTYMLTDVNKRPRQLFDMMLITLRYSCRYGEVYATPGMEAVAAWMPPGNEHESPWRMVRVGALGLIWSLGLPTIRSYQGIEELAHHMRSRCITKPHWYLSQLAVEPALQGRGYGRRLLTPTLKRIDGEGKAVCLETLNPKAIPFYQKLGFQVCEEAHLPKDGPPIWSMLREPQSG